MAKKVFFTIVFTILFVLALATNCFAESSSNSTTKLGNEVTSSMNKTEKDMDDLVDRRNLDEAGDSIKSGIKDAGNTIMDGMNDVGRDMEDLGDEDSKTRTDNRAVAGTTGNFTSGEVQTDGTGSARNGMTQNAWIWIVMVVVALIIIAAVWYYAVQK